MQNKHLGMQRARFEARGVFAIGLRPGVGGFNVLGRVEVPEYTQNRDGPFMDLHWMRALGRRVSFWFF